MRKQLSRRERKLPGVKLVISDAHLGLKADLVVAQWYPDRAISESAKLRRKLSQALQKRTIRCAPIV